MAVGDATYQVEGVFSGAESIGTASAPSGVGPAAARAALAAAKEPRGPNVRSPRYGLDMGPAAPSGGFRVPLGVAPDGQLVLPASAAKGVRYACPGCQAPIGLRKGERRRPHFAHRADPSGTCGADTVLHLSAKLLFSSVVETWLTGARARPIFVRRCAGLRTSYGCGRRVDHPMPRIDAVHVERSHDGLRPDVLLAKGGLPVAAIEILATHRVDEAKRKRTRLPWVELRAVDVLAFPDQWIPVQDHFRPLYCEACDAEAAEYASRYRNGYVHGETLCFRCGCMTVVYKWGDEWSKSEPPAPRPPTVKWRFSKSVGHRYWANTCEHCDALQGDFYLSNEPDGPFFALSRVVRPEEVRRLDAEPWDEDSRMDLVKDLRDNRKSI